MYLAEGTFRDKSLRWEHTCPLGQSEPEREEVREVTLNQIVKGLTAYSKCLFFSGWQERSLKWFSENIDRPSYILNDYSWYSIKKRLWELTEKARRRVKSYCRTRGERWWQFRQEWCRVKHDSTVLGLSTWKSGVATNLTWRWLQVEQVWRGGPQG